MMAHIFWGMSSIWLSMCTGRLLYVSSSIPSYSISSTIGKCHPCKWAGTSDFMMRQANTPEEQVLQL